MLTVRDKKTEFVYLISCVGTPYTKIGRTSRSVNNRLQDLQTSNPHELRVIYTIECVNSQAIEAYLHQRFKSRNIRNEWFSLSAQDIDAIKQQFQQGVTHNWT